MHLKPSLSTVLYFICSVACVLVSDKSKSSFSKMVKYLLNENSSPCGHRYNTDNICFWNIDYTLWISIHIQINNADELSISVVPVSRLYIQRHRWWPCIFVIHSHVDWFKKMMLKLYLNLVCLCSTQMCSLFTVLWRSVVTCQYNLYIFSIYNLTALSDWL